MKQVVFITLILTLAACGVSKQNQSISNTSTEQIFLYDRSEAKPGKCYQEVIKELDMVVMSEVICESQRTKSLINQVQNNLVQLGYVIKDAEIVSGTYGDSTKNALTGFQRDENLAFGGFDWATVNLLKQKAKQD